MKKQIITIGIALVAIIVMATQAIMGSVNFSMDTSLKEMQIPQPKYQYLTIPAIALTSWQDSQRYATGTVLYNTDPDFHMELFFAPIYLPENATINRLYIQYHKNTHSDYITVQLFKGVEGTYFQMEFYGENLPEKNQTDPPFISFPISETISNYQQPYILQVAIQPDSNIYNVGFSWVTIEYLL